MNIMGLGQNLKKIPVKYHGLRIGTASTNPSYFGVNYRVPGWPDPIMSFFYLVLSHYMIFRFISILWLLLPQPLEILIGFMYIYIYILNIIYIYIIFNIYIYYKKYIYVIIYIYIYTFKFYHMFYQYYMLYIVIYYS